jgi:hypothetical protein
MVELPPVFFVLMFFIVVPTIDLISMATGMASTMLLANSAVQRAATQTSYSNALNAMWSEAKSIQGSGLAQFVKLNPSGGYKGCGLDLYVEATDFRTKRITKFGPNTPVPPPIDKSTFVYEDVAYANFEVGPFVSLGFFPFMGDVPGLGRPATLRFKATRAVESPDGLDDNVGSSLTAKSDVAPFDTSEAVTGNNPQANVATGWNYPGIYNLIAAAGQHVVSDNVIEVPGSADWVNSNVSANKSQTVWIDTHAVGQWGQVAGDVGFNSSFSAAGNVPGSQFYSTGGNPNWKIMVSAPGYALIGCMGPPPPTVVAKNSPSANMFYVGPTLMNYPVTVPGPISFRINDSTHTFYNSKGAPYQGAQIVRIIVTR